MSRRFDIRFDVDDAHKIAGKSESRPYVLDWNRDGFDDLVLVLLEDLTDYSDPKNQRREFRYRHRIFVNSDSEARPELIRKGQAAMAKRAADYSDPASQMGAPRRGPDVKLNLRAVDLGLDDDAIKNPEALVENRVLKVHYVFADFDKDGNFDILFSEVNRQDIPAGPETGKTGAHHKISSSIFWMRNLTPTGEPKFASPVKLCDIPDGWQVNSFSAGELNNDGVMDAVVSVHQMRANREMTTELWLFKGE